MEELMILFLLIMVIIWILLYIRQVNITNAYRNELEKLMKKIFLESDLIEQSIQTLEQAYGISEGDLKDYISKYQEKTQKEQKK